MVSCSTRQTLSRSLSLTLSFSHVRSVSLQSQYTNLAARRVLVVQEERQQRRGVVMMVPMVSVKDDDVADGRQ